MYNNLEVLYTKTQIDDRVWQLSNEIYEDYYSDVKVKRDVVLVGILKGSFIFLSDLSRHMEASKEK